MAERRPWRRLVESYTVVVLQECRSVGMVRRGVLARRCGCGARWRNDVPWCPRKSMQPRCHEALCHGPPKGPPPSNCNPVASSRRASTFIALARSTTQQPASPAPPPLPPPLRPTTPSALRVYLLPIGRRPQPGRLIPTLARHVAESTAGRTPRWLPVRTIQARAAGYVPHMHEVVTVC